MDKGKTAIDFAVGDKAFSITLPGMGAVGNEKPDPAGIDASLLKCLHQPGKINRIIAQACFIRDNDADPAQVRSGGIYGLTGLKKKAFRVAPGFWVPDIEKNNITGKVPIDEVVAVSQRNFIQGFGLAQSMRRTSVQRTHGVFHGIDDGAASNQVR